MGLWQVKKNGIQDSVPFFLPPEPCQLDRKYDVQANTGCEDDRADHAEQKDVDLGIVHPSTSWPDRVQFLRGEFQRIDTQAECLAVFVAIIFHGLFPFLLMFRSTVSLPPRRRQGLRPPEQQPLLRPILI